MRSHRSAKSILAAFVFMVGLNACVKKLPPPPPPPPPPPAQSRASTGQIGQNQPTPRQATAAPPKGFWNAKDAPDVVSKIENWTYPGIYFPGANGVAIRVLIVGVMAMATGNGDGTTHWWGFTVQKVVLQNDAGRDLSFDVEDEKLSANANRPVIVLEGKYRLVPVGGNAATLSFQQLTTP